MSIQTKINEINLLKNELDLLKKESKKINENTKKIKEKYVVLQNEITDYLTENNQIGIKYKGMAILKKTNTKNKLKNKIDAQTDYIEILKKYGITECEKVLKELDNAKKGTVTEQSSLTFKKL